ncbi:MAG: hypothetical protein P8Z33_12560 [Gammaproteobacteria bacterium]
MARKNMIKRPGRLERILIRFSLVGLFAASILFAIFLFDQAAAGAKWIEVLVWFGFVGLAIVLVASLFQRK